MKFLDSIADAVLDRSPDELVGALLAAAVVAMAAAGLYALGWRKALALRHSSAAWPWPPASRVWY